MSKAASRNGEGIRMGTWHNYTVDLGDYVGQKYIAFRHFNCYNHYIMCLDDIELTSNAFAFLNWTENGNVVSTNSSYTFTVNSNRNLVANFTQQAPQSYHINVSANPTNGGSVSGGGTYQQGQSCTVHATANNGYTFVNWTENGTQVSTNANYTFTVNSNRNLVANFQQQSPQTYTISVSADPNNGGSVSGGGIYQQGQNCTVTATASNGYTFTNWTENGNSVSTNANYVFTVTSIRNLVANFEMMPTAPTGAINGLFTINANGDKVWFSQGNLQYKASTNTWRFADNQWDYVGEANSNIAPNNNGWIDLFGWGTSGYDHGAVCYQPWSTSTNSSDYNAYGNSSYNLYDQTGMADWGYNSIVNGGDNNNLWRTLTYQEWNYVFGNRNTVSGILFAKACLNGINGVVLLPDNWNENIYSFNNVNQSTGNSYDSNILNISQWALLQNEGVVFLPAAGSRIGTMVHDVDTNGRYWSSSCHPGYGVHSAIFNSANLNPSNTNYPCSGFSIRLIRDYIQ